MFSPSSLHVRGILFRFKGFSPSPYVIATYFC
nr:MAG TPA: hypothetical protein [Caudoviricetes sp.]